MRTVFFGPFIGEFGWELSFWHGWVRKMCRTEFQGDRKIASSYAGRRPFYPSVDEFWPIPDSFRREVASAHGYIADGWIGGYPGRRTWRYTLRSFVGDLRRGRRPEKVLTEEPLPLPPLAPKAEALLGQMKRRLPPETIFFTPWKWNRWEPDRLEFGVEWLPSDGEGGARLRERGIDLQDQWFEPLEPTEEGRREFSSRFDEKGRLIALFPRHRNLRRPEKNWPREKYLELIQRLQTAWPEMTVGLFGEPGGAYFSEGVPEGSLDLINVPASLRMDIQIAALKQARMALGGISGAMLVALAAGTPSLIWGYAAEGARYHRENVLGTPLIYHADSNASVEAVLELARSLQRMSSPTATRPLEVTK
ncbi:MAG: hypothetical protein HYZ90_02915 [Candidatus Omnitrophica bacterium]|nr:hypothetical protein [Candidatus Omnitrophota bacterium]